MSIAGYTLGELTAEVLTHQFSEPKYKPLVERWLNQAQRRAVIESELRTQEASETYATVSEQSGYALPTDFARLIDIFNSETSQLLVPLETKQFDSIPASTGRPYFYTVFGSNLTLYPTPDAVYPLTLRYWRLPVDMVAESDTPEIPVQYHELLIAYAMRQAFLRENDLQMAGQWEVQWEKGILKMRGEVQHDTFDGPKQVEGTWGDSQGVPPNVWRR